MSSNSLVPRSNVLVVFDMDGVLFDSEQVVLESYREAGADTHGDMPIGLTWAQWLVPILGHQAAMELHDEKNRIYIDKVRKGQIRSLPPLQLLMELLVEGEAAVATSASYDASTVLLRRGLGHLYSRLLYRFALNVLDKGSFLHDVGRVDRIFAGKFERYVYIDDRKELGQRVVDIANGMCSHRHLDPRWTFVHYHGQSYEELKEEVGA